MIPLDSPRALAAIALVDLDAVVIINDRCDPERGSASEETVDSG